MATTGKPPVELKSFLTSAGKGKLSATYQQGHTVYAQGDAADAVFYLITGKVQITTVSKQGKEGVIAIVSPGDFFGEGCLGGQVKRNATAKAITNSSASRLDKETVLHMLHKEPRFAEVFMTYLLARNFRLEADLIDQLFNSSEKRLARVLLLLANFGKEDASELISPKISQETLAEMIGTTRARVSFFMNKFRREGFIEYNGELKVHASLLNFILNEQS